MAHRTLGRSQSERRPDEATRRVADLLLPGVLELADLSCQWPWLDSLVSSSGPVRGSMAHRHPPPFGCGAP